MELEKIEEEMRNIVSSLDKGIRLDAVIEEKDEYQMILSKGQNSDKATLAKDRVEKFIGKGSGGHELKKTLGKVISKLNRRAAKTG